jgi:hypothetical protein
MQTSATAMLSEAAGICQGAVLSELSDTELDAVGAAGDFYGAFVAVSVGNIAVGFQVNNQVNVAVLSLGAIQGGSQTNINNAGTLISYARHF